jgi:hypothetical protein
MKKEKEKHDAEHKKLPFNQNTKIKNTPLSPLALPIPPHMTEKE